MNMKERNYIGGSVMVERDLTAGGNLRAKGDGSVGRRFTVGADATVRGCMKVCHDLRVDGRLTAGFIRTMPYKGLFATRASLLAAYPEPCPGWWALVGGTLPADVYTAEDGQWIPTGRQGGSAEIDPLLVKRTYKDTAAMEADTAPADTKGIPLRYGDLVMVYDPEADSPANGSLYAWQDPGWMYIATLNVRRDTDPVEEVTERLDPAADFTRDSGGMLHASPGVYARLKEAAGKGRRILMRHYVGFNLSLPPTGEWLEMDAAEEDTAVVLAGMRLRASGGTDTGGEVERAYQQVRLAAPAESEGTSAVTATEVAHLLFTGDDREAALFLNKQGHYVEAGMTETERSRLEKVYAKLFPVTLSASCSPALVLKGSANRVTFKAVLGGETGDTLTSCTQGTDAMELAADKRSATITYEGVVADTTYRARAATTAGDREATAGIRFVNPTFFGVVDADFTPDRLTPDTLPQKLAIGQKAYTTPAFTQTAQKCVYAYPASFGELAAIQDANGTPLKNSFTKTVKELDFGGGNKESYHIYVLTDPSTVTNYVLKFS